MEKIEFGDGEDIQTKEAGSKVECTSKGRSSTSRSKSRDQLLGEDGRGIYVLVDDWPGLIVMHGKHAHEVRKEINMDKDEMAEFADVVMSLFPDLKHGNINHSGKTVGVGNARKRATQEMEEYLMKQHLPQSAIEAASRLEKKLRSQEDISSDLQGEDRSPDIDSRLLSKRFPAIFGKAKQIAVHLEQQLEGACPPSVHERDERYAIYSLPKIGERTTSFYITRDYSSALHYNEDDGRCLAIGQFVEVHEPTCKRGSRGESCKVGWAFYLPEIDLCIELCHGTIRIWRSKDLLHGTSLDGATHPDGCKSKCYVFVNQIKRNHLQKKDLLKQDQGTPLALRSAMIRLTDDYCSSACSSL